MGGGLTDLQIPQQESQPKVNPMPAREQNMPANRGQQVQGYLTADPNDLVAESQKAQRRQQLKDDLLRDFTDQQQDMDDPFPKPLFPESPKDKEQQKK